VQAAAARGLGPGSMMVHESIVRVCMCCSLAVCVVTSILRFSFKYMSIDFVYHVLCFCVCVTLGCVSPRAMLLRCVQICRFVRFPVACYIYVQYVDVGPMIMSIRTYIYVYIYDVYIYIYIGVPLGSLHALWLCAIPTYMPLCYMPSVMCCVVCCTACATHITYIYIYNYIVFACFSIPFSIPFPIPFSIGGWTRNFHTFFHTFLW